MAALWWVIAAFVMAGLEVLSLALVFGTLVVAALIGALVAAFGGGFTAQAIIASVAALLLLALVRPLLVKRLNLQGRFRPTGTAAHVGRPARVIADVTELGGRVKLAGEDWSARSESPDRIYLVGEPVLVVEIDGATAVVTADPSRRPEPPGPAAPYPPGTTPEEPRP